MTEDSDNQRDGGGTRRKARRAAVQAVYQWLVAESRIGDLVRQFESGGRLSGCDRAYFDALVRGVAHDRSGLESTFVGYLDRPAQHLDPVERAVLLLAVFELRDRLEVPYRVVVNEALELAKRFGAEDGHRFVNGILDRVARDLRATEIGRPA